MGRAIFVHLSFAARNCRHNGGFLIQFLHGHIARFPHEATVDFEVSIYGRNFRRYDVAVSGQPSKRGSILCLAKPGV